jgi:hypothetical protein
MVATSTAIDLILTLDAFVRAVGVNRRVPHALFLGAGASVTSAVPSANTCIWEWKRKIVVTKNPLLGNQLSDISVPSVQEKLQLWLDTAGGFPPPGAPDEYGFYAKECYPILDDRRKFFQNLATSAKPYIGYELLPLLAEAEIIKSVWTTNFDGLSAKASATSNIIAIEAGLDTSERVMRQPQQGELLCVALHGDYRYDALKNTPEELQEQDSKLRQALVSRLRETNLIVVGYSGRDDSIMRALTEAYSIPGSGRLYWCGRDTSEPTGVVQQLLLTARQHDRAAYYVPTHGFDDLMIRLASHSLSGELLTRAQKVFSSAQQQDATIAPFIIDTSHAHIVGLIKSNAFAVEYPGEILQFGATDFDSPGAWERLKELTKGTRVVAGLMGGKVLALERVMN